MPAKKSKSPRKKTKAPRRVAKAGKPKAPRRLAKAPARKRAAPIPLPDSRGKRRLLEVMTSSSALQARMMGARTRGLTIGFVPTMGALHQGHAKLLQEGRRRADVLVASIFVNPKQFGAGEDLTRYPRSLASDRALCQAYGVDVLFSPAIEELYPPGFDTVVKAGLLGSILEGASRPGHFDGVLTVVNLLLSVVQPHFAIFGEKDFQQLALVRRMVRDLRMPVEIVAMPVLRDLDGLALSSRNAFLSEADRSKATGLYRALMAAQDEAQKGVVSSDGFVRAARAVLDDLEGAAVDYVEVIDKTTLERIDRLPSVQAGGEARIVMAVRLAGVRLLDNGPLFAGVRAAGVRYT